LSEISIQRRVMLGLGSMPDCRMFRNNVGMGYQGRVISRDKKTVILSDYRQIVYGLHPGSSDLIGWKTIEIGGKRLAVFAAVEVKQPGEKPRADQKNFLDMVATFGGIAGVVTSVSEAKELICGTL
jgi:hypothetical protein